jgi:hypothetical protein
VSTIHELYQQSQLALASYADFSNPNIPVEQALRSGGLSASQASSFLQSWRQVSQFTEGGLLSNGFSATLFERLDTNQQPTGQYTLAFRGSQDIRDFAGADLDLAVTSVARNQLISMVNYALRLQAGGTGFAQQLNANGTGLTQNVVVGVGPAIALESLVVSGHSLGGYLAQIYQRMFGSVGVFTFNALGIRDSNASFFDQVSTLLGLPSESLDQAVAKTLSFVVSRLN